MLVILVTLQIREDQVDGFPKRLAPCIDATRAESGNISYTLLQKPENSRQFTVIEQWESPKALASHLESEHMAEANKMFGEVLDGAPQVEVFVTTGAQQVEDVVLTF